MLKNAYLDAKFRCDTDENEPKKESCVAANRTGWVIEREPRGGTGVVGLSFD